MRIYSMMTNRLTNPLGFDLGTPRLCWKIDDTEGRHQSKARVRVAADESFSDILFDSGEREDLDSLSVPLNLVLSSRTRYFWDVEVTDDAGGHARSDAAWFETGKMDEPWRAKWITAPVTGDMILSRKFAVETPVKSARLYATGFGLYEVYINGHRVGDELMTPFCNQYAKWIQVQTYDVTDMLTPGRTEISCWLGNGWYMGRFGFKGEDKNCGDTQAMLLELKVEYENGQFDTIATSESGWKATESPVRFDNIYDGEVFDATFESPVNVPCELMPTLDYSLLRDRLSPPVRIIERLNPVSIFADNNGDTILDLGQEITGYLEFIPRAEKGAVLKLYYFELLQEGNYYRDNLRSAKQEYTYISDGLCVPVAPHFTFFGFRYVKLEGFSNPTLDDFTGCCVHSDIQRTAWFESSNPKLNRLFENARWGMRDNFLDVPTDCPQRDERMGWTGDAQAFSGTACYLADTQAFFDKFIFDMKSEQEMHDGAVPHTVPSIPFLGASACGWADAAAIIPWNLYTFYGDKTLLEKQYPVMRAWVDWLKRNDDAHGATRLWQNGFHFGDWLALDTKDGSPMGGTDEYYVASAYYYYSTSLLVKAAKVLGKDDDAATYSLLLDEIRQAIHREYFTPSGALAQTTQTGYILALFMGFAPEGSREKLAALLKRQFEKSRGKLNTGFIGTAYLCGTLSDAGLSSLAYSLLLNEEYPGWLFEVNMGATTVWERWSSLLPNGKVSDITMNSMNHYAYGAVMEWVFRSVAGIAPVEDTPGFRRALLNPRPDERLPQVSLRFNSPTGIWESTWKIEDGKFVWNITVPFGATARAIFPGTDADAFASLYPGLSVVSGPGGLSAELDAGTFEYVYPYNSND